MAFAASVRTVGFLSPEQPGLQWKGDPSLCSVSHSMCKISKRNARTRIQTMDVKAAIVKPELDFKDPSWKKQYQEEFEKRFNLPHLKDIVDVKPRPTTFSLVGRDPIQEGNGALKDMPFGYVNDDDRALLKPCGVGKIAKLINAGHIDSSELITIKNLKDTGAIGKQVKDGVRLMGRGAELIKWPIHLEVTRVTARAKAAVEAMGGSVRKVFYNKLGFRALLKPEWFAKKRHLLPKPARPPPKQRDKVDSIGRLPAPTKPIPFETKDKQVSATQTDM